MKVISATQVGDFQIKLEFSDGKTGIADFRRFLRSKRAAGTVYEPLRQPSFFRQFKIDKIAGTLCWTTDIDFPVEFLYSLVKPSFSRAVTTRYDVVAMPRMTLQKIAGCDVYMYQFDTDKHKEPHFHVHTPQGDAVVRISNLTVLESSGGQKVIRSVQRVIDWAVNYTNELADAWRAAVVGESVLLIQPAVAVIDGFEIRIYGGDSEQRKRGFVRVWKEGQLGFVYLNDIKPITGAPKSVITWITQHKDDLYEKWALSLLRQKMGLIKGKRTKKGDPRGVAR